MGGVEAGWGAGWGGGRGGGGERRGEWSGGRGEGFGRKMLAADPPKPFAKNMIRTTFAYCKHADDMMRLFMKCMDGLERRA